MKKAGGNNEIVISRTVSYTGVRKVGLDSCVLYNLIVYVEDFDKKRAEIFNNDNLIFTHQACLKETKKNLMKYEDYTEEEARDEVIAYINKKKIGTINADPTNTKILYDLREKCRKENIGLHKPDDFIIADFKKNGINMVYSIDNEFRKACEVIGLNAVAFPTYTRELDDKIRNALSKNRYNK
ncbi:MAG: PIN domain-containing protein [Candidatus Nanoarchaeia archaeon]|nr:PIN domain-containing protein [Candidatus Nanoarchaeia archaeon]